MLRLTKIAVPMTAAVLIAGGVTASASARSAASQSDFWTASVTYDSGVYKVSWSSSDPRVTIVANHDRQSADKGSVVATGKASGTARISNLSGDARWYFHLQGSHGDSVVVARQSLGLAHDPNLRDLGGYRTEDGKWVKEGLLFRGGRMSDLTAAESASLTALDVAYDIDMRTPGEVTHHPDVVPAGATYIARSVLLPDDPAATTVIPGLDDSDSLRTFGYSTGVYQSLYLELGGEPSETYAYRQIFGDILAADGSPVLYHCTAGNDRTGWASFVLLKLLGVPEKTALNDYTASNFYGNDLLQSYNDYYASLGFTAKQSDFFLKKAYIATALRSAEMVYGSFDNYVRLGLGLNSTDIAKLRATYLSS